MIVEARAYPAVFDDKKKIWKPTAKSSRLETDRQLYRYATYFVNAGKRAVMKDKHQRRVILMLENERGRRNFYLVGRVVPNPGDVYIQRDGVYNGFRVKAIPVILDDIKRGTFSIENRNLTNSTPLY